LLFLFSRYIDLLRYDRQDKITFTLYPLTIFHMLHMLSYNLVSRNSFLDGHFPLSQRNNLVTKRSRDLLQRLASSFPGFARVS
jgi:hypothetical protein